MTREATSGNRVRLIAIVAVVALLGVVGGYRGASAAGTLYFSGLVAPADGLTTLTATYVGDTTGTGDTLGQSIRFSVAPASGSAAVPKFGDGSTTTTVTLVGAACDATQHPPIGTLFTTCYASVQFNSAAAGDVIGLTLSVAPVSAGVLGTISASATTPGAYTAIYTPITSVAGNGIDSVTVTARLTAGVTLSQTTTFAQSGAAATVTLISSAATVAPSGYLLLTATLKDSGGRTVATAGAPTVTFTGTGSGTCWFHQPQ